MSAKLLALMEVALQCCFLSTEDSIGSLVRIAQGFPPDTNSGCLKESMNGSHVLGDINIRVLPQQLLEQVVPEDTERCDRGLFLVVRRQLGLLPPALQVVGLALGHVLTADCCTRLLASS